MGFVLIFDTVTSYHKPQQRLETFFIFLFFLYKVTFGKLRIEYGFS